MRPSRRLIGLLAGLCLVAPAAACEWPAGTRYVHVVFNDIESHEDILYRTAPDSTGQLVELKVDIFEPAGDDVAQRPAVMWMFGGGWQWGDRNQLQSYAEDSARRGYVGVSIDYRIRPNVGGRDAALDAYDDAVAAVQWLKDNAGTYGIDAEHIFAAGYSAGAINALHLLYMPPERGPATSPIAGAAAIAGLSFSPPMGGEPRSIMHLGTTDPLIPYETVSQMCRTVSTQGGVCRLETYQGQGHEIGVTQATAIRETTHDFFYEHILLLDGY